MSEDFGSKESPAAFLGSTSSAKTMADGTLRITVDLSPADAIGAFTAFGSPGSPVGVARIHNQAALEADRPKAEKPYGQQAQILFQSSFFRNPNVWEAVGTDKEYLEWVKRQPSAYSRQFSEYHDDGEAYCIPAHVRRVGHGSGTAIKPPYSAIPLTNTEHQKTHQHGDNVIGDKEWWAGKRIFYIHKWCWETAKDKIQAENPDIECDSWGTIPPRLTLEWARSRGIQSHLPAGYINGQNEEHQETSET